MRNGTCFWIGLLSALVLVAAAGAQAGDPAVTQDRRYGGSDTGDAIVPGPGGIGFFLTGGTVSLWEGSADAGAILPRSVGSGVLSGRVWYDLNADGVSDLGEPGIPGIDVRLIGERSMLDYTVTDPDGSYRFPDIPAVGYLGVEFVLPDGYACTLPGLGSDASPQEGGVAFAEGGAGRQTLNAGFVGSYLSGTPEAVYGWVLGTTWSDDNRDGVRDESYGMTDVEVRLLDAGGNATASARTVYHDRYTSFYLFGPLLPGEYSLAFTVPDGYVFTSPGGDSHADPETGTTAPFEVAGGETVVRDAGLIPVPISG